MIWYMHTKTFKKVFAKTELPAKILRAQYVIVSSRIKKNRDHGNVVSVSKLFPKAEILADARWELTSSYFERAYRDQLDACKMELAVIVKSAIELRQPVIFLCTPKEYKIGYMKVLKNYVFENFHYPMTNYLKYKKGEVKLEQWNIKECCDACDHAIRKGKKAKFNELAKTRSGRKKILDGMSKDEMVSMLKKMNLWSHGLSKSDMRDLLKTFFVGSRT